MDRFFTLILLISLFTGCSQTTVLLLDSGKKQNAILVVNEIGTTKLDTVGNYINLADKNKPASQVKTMSESEIKSRFGKVLASIPLKPLSYRLYFKANSKELTDVSMETLEEALKSIEERSPCSVDIIGHTDTTGSNALNVKVSLKRAKYIETLIKKKGIKIVSLVAKGYGEEDLFVKTQDNIAEAKNRNVEIFIK